MIRPRSSRPNGCPGFSALADGQSIWGTGYGLYRLNPWGRGFLGGVPASFTGGSAPRPVIRHGLRLNP